MWQKKRVTELSADEAAAAEKALEYLCARDHSAAELYEKLCRRFTEHAAAFAMAKMQQAGYLDDEKYARGKVRVLAAQHKSRRAIGQVLRQKGVEPALADGVLAEHYDTEPEQDGPDPEAQAALALIERHYRKKLADGRRDLVMAALARRGFAFSTIKAALAAAEQNESENEQL